jgi:hypothetical protein
MKRSRLGIVCLIALLGLPSRAHAWTIDGSSEDDMWQVVDGPRGGSVAALALSPNYAADGTVFAGLRAAGIYRTTDWGQSWECLSGDPWAIVDLAISPAYANDGTIFTTHGTETVGFDILRSTDGGDSWWIVTLAWSALPDPPRLSISPNFASDGTLYVLGGAQTYLSTD